MKEHTTVSTPHVAKRRLRRLLVVAPKPSPQPLAREIVLTSAWLGIMTGMLELLILQVRKLFLNAAAMGSLQLSKHAIWTIPVSNLLILGACGLVLATVAAVVRRRQVHLVASYVLFSVATLTLMLTFHGLSTTAYVAFACGLASRIVPFVRAREARFAGLVRASLPVLLILVGGLTAYGVSREKVAERSALAKLATPPKGSPNVLMIVLDTVRAESLSTYGYGRDTSPNLTKLARRGVRFDQARVTCSWTLPSHASMFTGRWPHEMSARLDRPLDGTFPTLAEVLGGHGYATAGFVANTFFCNTWYGLGRGFLHYEDTAMTSFEVLRGSALGRHLLRRFTATDHDRPTAFFRRKDAPTINQEALDWLAQRPKDRPFFMFLNYYDAHDPYFTPDGTSRRFGTHPTDAADRAMLRDWHRIDKKALSPKQVELARDCYDDCISYLDEQLGRLLDSLESQGILKDTMIVVTSDHGEQFGEHGCFGHGHSLYRPGVHVPLLVVSPSRVPAGSTVAEPTSLRDLPATVLDVLGLDTHSPFPGRSLARHWDGSRSAADDADDFVLSELVDKDVKSPPNWVPPRSIISEGKAYIRESDGHEELYDVASDPAEAKNLVTSEEFKPLLERFRQTLGRIENPAPTTASNAPRPEVGAKP